MSTINISLPEVQTKLIDRLVIQYNFSNRSEFFRAMIRKLLFDTQLIKETATFPFNSPVTRSKKTIIDGFTKNPKYSPEFIKDLKEGLNNSDYFV